MCMHAWQEQLAIAASSRRHLLRGLMFQRESAAPSIRICSNQNEAHARTRREKKKIIKKENRRPTDRKWGLVLPCSVWNGCAPSGPTEIFVPLATMDDASKLILTCHIANRPVGQSRESETDAMRWTLWSLWWCLGFQLSANFRGGNDVSLLSVPISRNYLGN
jgi:hypothetical protein